MIRMVEMECPNCGATLQRVNKDTCKCGYCNAYFLIDREADKVVVIPKETAPKENDSVGVILSLVVLILVLLGSIFVMIKDKEHDSTSPEVVTQEKKNVISTSYFTDFVYQVFEKTPEEVTNEELASITYLKMFEKSGKSFVEYQIGTKDVKQVEVQNDSGYPMTDLKYFTGLEDLDVKGYDLISDYLSSDVSLKRLVCDNSPEELTAILAHKDSLETLSLHYREDSLAGIENFTNLKSFEIDNYELTNLTQLSHLQKLENLSVKSDALSHYAVIGSLPQLTQLKLDAEGVRDLSFLESCKKLTDLEVIDTQINDISFVQKLTQLNRLVLDDNREVKDYSAITNLENLETLSLYCSSKTQQPDFGQLQNLVDLTLRGIGDLESIQTLTNLKILKVYGCSNADLQHLSQLVNLEELLLRSSYGDIKHFEVLSQLPNLKSLDLSDTSIFLDVTDVFSIPTLEELNLSNSKVGLEVDKVPMNESLKILNLNEVQFLTNMQVVSDGFVTMADYDRVEYSDYNGIFANFPNLQELYIKGNKVDSIEFASQLSNLKILDISDNYVRDLKPLGSIAGFEIVYCKENPISQGLDLSDQFTIIQE